MLKICVFKKNAYICSVIKKQRIMKKVYYSAVVKLENGIVCVIGMKTKTTEVKINDEKMEGLYGFVVERYFGPKCQILAFSRISKKDFETKTCLTISAVYE